MNMIFAIGFLTSMLLILIISPESALSAISLGGQRAVTLTIKMIGIYVFWLGIIEIIESLSLSKKLSKLMTPVMNFLFGETDKEAKDLMTMNICLNMLGVGNSATPIGMKAIATLKKSETATYPMIMFFVINATSVQLIPTTIISLRAESGSLSPFDIIFPSLLVSIFSTVVGVLLVKIFVKKGIEEFPLIKKYDK